MLWLLIGQVHVEATSDQLKMLLATKGQHTDYSNEQKPIEYSKL